MARDDCGDVVKRKLDENSGCGAVKWALRWQWDMANMIVEML